MKTKSFFKLISTTLLVTMLGINSLNANVWRVNNRDGVDADFTNIMHAHNSGTVQEGDTLYVEASSGSHGDVDLTKKLVIIGPGFFLAENPETQADQNSAVIGSLTFKDGSQGSIVKGCRIENVDIKTSDIIFQGNRIRNTEDIVQAVRLGENINNIIIKNNYIVELASYTINNSAIRGRETGMNNVTIKNNYIYHTDRFRRSLSFGSGFSGTIENNVLHGEAIVRNAEFHNNILREGDFSPTNTNYTHNIGNNDQFGTENGNQQNVDMDDVFVGAEGNSTDGQWQLAEGSPAIGSGVDGTDIGMFGGDNPFKLSGVPNIPAIYEIEHTINYENQEIEVEFSTKSHN